MRMSPKRRILTVGGIGVLVLCALTIFVLHRHDASSLAPERLHTAQLHDPRALLAEAERLALLGNWAKARPLFAEAEQKYSQRGDERDALRARIGRLRCDVERTSYAAGAGYIGE